MVSTYTFSGVISGLAALALLYGKYRRRNQIAPLPPGPKGDFLIGNVRDLPQTRMFDTFTEWQKTYGDLIHLDLLGIHMLIVNSFECAVELGNKRAEWYSHRAQSVMLNDVLVL